MNPSHPCAVDPLEPVHRVLNPREFNQRAVSLHVYSRPFDTCVVYSPSREPAERSNCTTPPNSASPSKKVKVEIESLSVSSLEIVVVRLECPVVS